MRFSQLFTKTRKENPRDETSANAILLERGGYVAKNSAGIYSFLPLGWRVMQRIMHIIREEINAVEGQEMFMPALLEKKYLDATRRWEIPIGFKVREEKESTFVLGWTHEEVITTLASHYVESYRDLPFAAYQIQSKFRNEPRATSGLLRGREFLMKDLYSFHADEKDLQTYYARVADAYKKIFERCGLDALYTKAGGGDFTAEFTHEFQVLTEVGEDTILHCPVCRFAENSEVATVKKGNECPACKKGRIEESRGIEVGNIFPLGTKYSDALNLRYIDESGNKKSVVMGSYGIGISRLMGTAVEIHHDGRGIIWPKSLAPYAVHLIPLTIADEAEGTSLYNRLLDAGVEVLFDDRIDVRAGEKFADADLLGMPLRILISSQAREKGGVEVKERLGGNERIMNFDDCIEYAQKYIQ